MARESQRRQRVPVRLKACIYCRGKRLSTCWSKDIGPRGIFLATGNLAYLPGTPVEVEFMLPGRHSMRPLRLQAVVKASSSDGTDLEFTPSGALPSHSARGRGERGTEPGARC
jgi:hypothetical protein